MNILIVSSMFYPIRTGSSNYTLALAETLYEKGHNVSVVTVRLKNYNDEEDNKFPFSIYRLPCIHIKLKRFFNWFTIVSFNLKNYYRLYKIIKSNDIQIVHQVNHYLDSAILTRIVCGILKIPFVVSIHTQLQFKKNFLRKFLILTDKIISGKIILKKAAAILSFNTEVLRYLNNTYPYLSVQGKINTEILRGIKINLMDYPVKQDYSLNNLILSVGHLINIRNRISLIKAMAIITKRFPNVKLEIIGHIYIEEPIKLVKDLGLEKNIFFTGELPREKIKERFIEADLHAVWVTSEYLGLGTAISESMLCGLPVVNNSPSNLIGNNKLKDMENIVLIHDENVQEIADKIITLLENDELRKKIGQNGRNLIKENYDFENVIKNQLSLYKSLINEK